MTYQERARFFRNGICLDARAAPHLLAPAGGIAAPTDPAAYAAAAERLSTPSMRGVVNTRAIELIREASAPR